VHKNYCALDESLPVFKKATSKTKDRASLLLETVRFAEVEVLLKAGAKKAFEKLYAEDPAFADVGERLWGLA
jgi:hypothetical protein